MLNIHYLHTTLTYFIHCSALLCFLLLVTMNREQDNIVSTKVGKNRSGAPETAPFRAFCSQFQTIVNLPQLTDLQTLSLLPILLVVKGPDPESLHHTSTNSLKPRHLEGGSPPLADRGAAKAGRTPQPTTKFSRQTATHQYPTPLSISLKTPKKNFSDVGVAWDVVSTPINARMLKMGILAKMSLSGVSTEGNTGENITQ